MFLYHGTSARFLEEALADGIRPRGVRATNWKNAPSRTDMVYLAHGYPFYYALVGTDDPKVAVFEIDSSLIDDRRLYPDEDYIWHVAAEGEPARGQKLLDLKTEAFGAPLPGIFPAFS